MYEMHPGGGLLLILSGPSPHLLTMAPKTICEVFSAILIVLLLRKVHDQCINI